jgi:hypothetical protein
MYSASMKHLVLTLSLLSAIAAPAAAADIADVRGELRGSRTSIRHQHEVARDADLTFLRTPAQVREFVAKERLEQVTSTADLEITKVSFPYTRPIVKTFLERLAAQYRAATGERLVVTSLTRPTSRQPRNASPYSVHPAGIAVDFRVPRTAAERSWLEQTLLELENTGVLDVTRERRPPHYHVAVFPEEYEAYVTPRIAEEIAQRAENVWEAAVRAIPAAALPDASGPATAPRLPPMPLLAALGAIILLVAWAMGTRSRPYRHET